MKWIKINNDLIINLEAIRIIYSVDSLVKKDFRVMFEFLDGSNERCADLPGPETLAKVMEDITDFLKDPHQQFLHLPRLT